MDMEEFRDTVHLPEDAGEYEAGLLDILNRIPVGWGRWISCDKGWYKLLVETNERMKYMCPDYEIHQVKEKFGTLRYYWGIPSGSVSLAGKTEGERKLVMDIMSAIAHQAENQSAYVCESCGSWGETRGEGWLRTLCKDCAVEQGYPLNEWETNQQENTLSGQ